MQEKMDNNLEDEVWIRLRNSNYFISNLGRVKTSNFNNTNKEGLMGLKIEAKGYCRISLRIEKNKEKRYSLHRLVAECFIPNPENKPFINHKNGIKTDNRVDNLEWVTQKENIQHAIETGLFLTGEVRSDAKLTQYQVDEIRQKYKYKIISYGILAKEYKVSKTTIKNIIDNKTWAIKNDK